VLTIRQRTMAAEAADAELSLPFELRQKSRLLTHLASGEEVGLMLERGTVLRGGDSLLTDDGRVVRVVRTKCWPGCCADWAHAWWRSPRRSSPRRGRTPPATILIPARRSTPASFTT
jgi:hypothetical protein